MVLTPSSCTVQVPMLVTQSWHSDSMANCTLLNHKTVGTGPDMAFNATSSHNGKNGLRMLTSTLHTCHSHQRLELNSTRLLLKNSSLPLKVSPMVTTTSSSAGLIPQLITYHHLCHQVSSQLSSQFLNTSNQTLSTFSTIKP